MRPFHERSVGAWFAAFAGTMLAVFSLSACLGPAGGRPIRTESSPPPARVPHRSGVFRVPLAGSNVKLLSRFGKRGRRMHEGVDIRISRKGGEAVFASAPGRVAEANAKHRGYGRQVLLEHDDGWFTRYAHLRAISVRPGQWVEAGEKVGVVGSSGRASGPHLHFEILTPKRRQVDPVPYIFKKS